MAIRDVFCIRVWISGNRYNSVAGRLCRRDIDSVKKGARTVYDRERVNRLFVKTRSRYTVLVHTIPPSKNIAAVTIEGLVFHHP